MKIERRWLEELVFSGDAPRRFTQDSPILPDVWLEYGENGSLTKPVDLLLTPWRQTTPAELAKAVHGVVGDSPAAKPPRKGRVRKAEAQAPDHGDEPPLHEIASNQSVVAARLSFDEMVRTAAALGAWPASTTARSALPEFVAALASEEGRRQVAKDLRALAERGENQLRLLKRTDEEKKKEKKNGGTKGDDDSERSTDAALRLPAILLWLIRVVGSIRLGILMPEKKKASREDRLDRFRPLAWRFRDQVEQFADVARTIVGGREGKIFLIGRNRAAAPALERSVVTVKADAARRLFHLDCDRLRWAIVDSGVDATHPAFRKRDSSGEIAEKAEGPAASAASRVVETYDFTVLRSLLNPSDAEREVALRRLREKLAAPDKKRDDGSVQRAEKVLAKSLAKDEGDAVAKQLRTMLATGKMLDWSLLKDLIRIPHDDRYEQPSHDHGTHVAGILAADWQGKDHENDPHGPPDEDLVGMCPDIGLIDLRVFDAKGTGDEFAVMAALQFIRWLNQQSEQPAVHGANLSMSIRHDVTNFACGRTPVCDECSRLVNSGVVVVAAAGNAGRATFTLASGEASEGYRSISISDPGNTDEVITVGATHRYQPHSYGVSYFSSRGPTGDGRLKPDLVAPGERITSTIPKAGAATKDGTSMAAPHVSGAAALLLARHRELLGRPLKVKEILCATATDLRRERQFQGAGLVDVLRAIQSI